MLQNAVARGLSRRSLLSEYQKVHSATIDTISFTQISEVPPSLRRAVGSGKRGADKSLARPGRKQATATADFEFHIYYL